MKRTTVEGRIAILLLLGLSAAAAGCTGASKPNFTIAGGGNPQRGKRVIENKGCGACHVIPGIYTARGVVGPPLYFWGRRTIIAGELPNTPANLVRWLKDPPAIEPGTAMPDLGLTDQQAHDVAAYLFRLR